MPESREYVKLWTSYSAYFEPLGDAEVGRLARAMIEYKSHGVEPKFSGNERFVWPAIKRDMDEAERALAEYSQKQAENGAKGGRPKKPTAFDENPKNPPLFSETQKSLRTKDKGQRTMVKGQRTKDYGQVMEANASCAEPDEPTRAPVITLPLNDGSEYPISPEQCQEWAGLYPAVDVIQQLRGMRGWLLSNPAKRKTARGILRFVTAWLAREQDRGGSRTVKKPAPVCEAGRQTLTAEELDELEASLRIVGGA